MRGSALGPQRLREVEAMGLGRGRNMGPKNADTDNEPEGQVDASALLDRRHSVRAPAMMILGEAQLSSLDTFLGSRGGT